MKFQKNLLEGLLLKRYKRFFADVKYEGEQFTIHVPNTGSLKGVIEKDVAHKCWFSLHGDKSKKLCGTLEAVQTSAGAWVGVNTSNPNRIVQEAIVNSIQNQKPHFEHWANYGFYKSEHKISKETRLDGVFCKVESDLENPNSKKHFIEIKNTTLMSVVGGENIAMFPDAVTERGQKHLKEMMALMAEGHKAELIFTIQRNDAVAFAPAAHIDPEYAKLLQQAIRKGLIVSPVVVSVERDQILLTQKVLNILD